MKKNNIERLIPIVAFICLSFILISNGSPIFERLPQTILNGLLFIITSVSLLKIPQVIDVIKGEESKIRILLEILYLIVFSFYSISYIYLVIRYFL